MASDPAAARTLARETREKIDELARLRAPGQTTTTYYLVSVMGDIGLNAPALCDAVEALADEVERLRERSDRLTRLEREAESACEHGVKYLGARHVFRVATGMPEPQP